jgi:hypothetical protein
MDPAGLIPCSGGAAGADTPEMKSTDTIDDKEGVSLDQQRLIFILHKTPDLLISVRRRVGTWLPAVDESLKASRRTEAGRRRVEHHD